MVNIARNNESEKEKSPEIKRFLQFVKSRRLKWAELADSTEISERTITNYVYNDEPIGGPLLRKLLEIYGVSIDWIFSGKGHMYVEGTEMGADYQMSHSEEEPLIPYIEHTDITNFQDFWWLTAKALEQSLMQSGAEPGTDYSMLDLYQLAQPFVLERFKSTDMNLSVFGD